MAILGVFSFNKKGGDCGEPCVTFLQVEVEAPLMAVAMEAREVASTEVATGEVREVPSMTEGTGEDKGAPSMTEVTRVVS